MPRVTMGKVPKILSAVESSRVATVSTSILSFEDFKTLANLSDGAGVLQKNEYLLRLNLDPDSTLGWRDKVAPEFVWFCTLIHSAGFDQLVLDCDGPEIPQLPVHYW